VFIDTPPSPAEAHEATRQALYSVVAILDGKLDINGCPRKGRRSRVCAADIKGRDPLRLSVVVTNDGDGWLIRARLR
jgi:hypothetical protein